MKKQRIALLLVSMILFLGAIVYTIWHSQSIIMGIRCINDEEYNEIVNSHERMWMDFSLYLDDVELEFVYHDNIYLIPQSLESESWDGNLTYKSADGDIQVYFYLPAEDKYSLISNQREFKIVFVRDGYYDMRNACFTGLSLVILNTYDVEDDMNYGLFRIFETKAGNREGVLAVEQTDCRFHVRGASSFTSEKKAYKVNLLDEEGNSLKKSFLGMRDDNDWILNPMYIDESEMKEMISYDIWNTISSNYQHGLEYVELVLDGKYIGLYCLQEPVDLKTFGLNDRDSFLFSVKNWYAHEQDSYLYSDELAINLKGGYAVVDDFKVNKYSTTMVDDIVQVLREVKNQINGEETNQQVILNFDKNNVIEYTVFLNLIQASDNAYKNQKVAVKKTGENTYSVYKTSWDLDWVMFTEDRWRVILEDELYFGGDSLEDEIREFYYQCRDTFYTVDNMHLLIDSYYDFLVNSGAVAREMSRWNQDFEKACQDLKLFFELRIPYLDEYYDYGGNDGI